MEAPVFVFWIESRCKDEWIVEMERMGEILQFIPRSWNTHEDTKRCQKCCSSLPSDISTCLSFSHPTLDHKGCATTVHRKNLRQESLRECWPSDPLCRLYYDAVCQNNKDDHAGCDVSWGILHAIRVSIAVQVQWAWQALEHERLNVQKSLT
jgi:hypothetical protein